MCKLWAKLPLPFMEHVVRVGEGFIRATPLAIPSCVCAIPSPVAKYLRELAKPS